MEQNNLEGEEDQQLKPNTWSNKKHKNIKAITIKLANHITKLENENKGWNE